MPHENAAIIIVPRCLGCITKDQRSTCHLAKKRVEIRISCFVGSTRRRIGSLQEWNKPLAYSLYLN